MSILYIDPSVMTYAIQAIAGIAIAIGAFVGIYLRKAKKKINNKELAVLLSPQIYYILHLAMPSKDILKDICKYK